MNKDTIFSFITQVKQEFLAVSWPTKKEVINSSITVVLMVAVSACIFFLVDVIVHWFIELILR